MSSFASYSFCTSRPPNSLYCTNSMSVTSIATKHVSFTVIYERISLGRRNRAFGHFRRRTERASIVHYLGRASVADVLVSFGDWHASSITAVCVRVVYHHAGTSQCLAQFCCCGLVDSIECQQCSLLGKSFARQQDQQRCRTWNWSTRGGGARTLSIRR